MVPLLCELGKLRRLKKSEGLEKFDGLQEMFSIVPGNVILL
jgi:hypothetical protein